MKKTTFYALARVPFIGPIVKCIFDPMLFCSPALQDGFPKEICDYMNAHPDTFITRRLLKEIMNGKK